MPDRIPPLSTLRCFEAAARLQSFSRAGDELFLTHGAISRQIKLLEEHLGIQLFERRNRGVFLTDSGRSLLATASEIFARLRDTCDHIRLHSGEPIVVSCEPTLTQYWLIPRLPQLRAKFPDLVMHVLAAGGPVQFERDHVDLAIRRNDFQWSADTFSELIMDEKVGPICSPTFAKGGPKMVLHQPLIHTATRPDAWHQWFTATRRTPLSNPSLRFEHFYLSIQAAIAGLGIAIGPLPLVADAIENGRLVAPFGFISNGFGYYLLSRRPIEMDDRSRSILSWLRSAAPKGKPRRPSSDLKPSRARSQSRKSARAKSPERR